MKNLLLILFVTIFIFFSCTTDMNEAKVKEIIKEVITTQDNSINSGYGKVNQKIYPISTTTFNLPSFSTSAFAGDGNGYIDVDSTTKDSNFISGIFYHDISFNSTDPLYGGIWRTLDLSAQVGNQESKATIYVKVVGIDQALTELNETARFKFRSPDAILTPVEATSKYGDASYLAVQVTTDENGCIQWCYTGNNPYDAKFVTGDPDYHDYRWMECEIWLYEYWKSEVVN